MIRRQHLALHMKTVVFTAFELPSPLLYEQTLGRVRMIFNRSIGPDRGGVEREGEREEAAMFESVTEQSRTINHGFSLVIICRRSFVLNSSSCSIVYSFFPDWERGGPVREPHCRRSSATIVQSHSIISMCMCKQNLLNLFPLFLNHNCFVILFSCHSHFRRFPA